MYIYVQLHDDADPLGTVDSFVTSSAVEINDDLSYSYSVTLNDTSDVEIYAWYTVFVPGLHQVCQWPPDTLGTLPETYSGSGIVSIPDTVYTVGDDCYFFMNFGYAVYDDGYPNDKILEPIGVERKTFEVVTATRLAVGDSQLPAVETEGEYIISEVSPNPFNASAKFSVHLPKSAILRVELYNITGQKVKQISDGHFAAGIHEFVFISDQLSSGLYFICCTLGDQQQIIRKITLLR